MQKDENIGVSPVCTKPRVSRSAGKECKNCPFKKGMEWNNGGIFWKMAALEQIEAAGNIFSCHMKHPDNNVFHGKMIDNDCSGFKKMLDNMENESTHKNIVNNFLETNPKNYDFIGWAKSEGKEFALLKGLEYKRT